MKLQEVTLDNFGAYAHRRLELDAASVVLIYGENESGKTTALNGIRQTLYGFETRTPYLTGQPMSGAAKLLSADGREVEFSRRKGREDSITAAVNGSPVSPDTLRHLLCNLSLEDYRALFGFSLDELRRGEEALRSAPLTHALAGGGIDGIMRLESLYGSLTDTAEQLYSPRASKRPINLLLRHIQDTREELRQCQLTPSAVENLREQMSKHQAEADQLREKQSVALKRRAQAERFLKAQPLCRRLSELEQQLERIDVPSDVDAKALANWSELNRQRSEFEKSATESATRIAALSSELDQLGDHTRFAGHENAIQLIGSEAGIIEEKQGQLADLENRLNKAQAARRKHLQSLKLTSSTAELEAVAIPESESRRMRELAKQHASVEQKLLQLQTRLEALSERGAAEQTSQPTLDEHDLLEIEPAVEALLVRQRALGQLADQVKQLEESNQLRELERRVLRGLESQSAFGSSASALDTLKRCVLPTDEELAEIDDALDQVQQEQHSRRRGLEKASKNKSELLAKIARTIRPHDNQLLAQWNELRNSRDEITRQWLDELTQPLIASSISTTLQHSRLTQLEQLAGSLDTLHEQLLRCSESFAEQALLKESLQTCEEDIAADEEHVKVLEARVDRVTAEAKEHFNGLALREMSVKQLRRWSADATQWQSMAMHLQEKRQQLYVQQSLLNDSRDGLADLWPTSLPATCPPEWFAERLADWKNEIKQSKEREADLKQQEAECERLAAEIKALAQQKSAILEEYTNWLQTLPISADHPLDDVQLLLDGITGLQNSEQECQHCQRSIDAIEKQQAEFERAVVDVEASLDVQLPKLSATRKAQLFLEQLQASQQHQQKSTRLTATLEQMQKQHDETVVKKSAAEKRIVALCEMLGDSDPGSVNQSMQRLELSDQLKSQIDRLRESIAALSPTSDVGAFAAEAQACDAGELEREIHQLQQTIEGCDEQREVANRAIGALEEKFEQLSDNNAAAETRQKLQALKAELSEQATSWIQYTTAKHILKQSIELYADENEPALLRLAREYLTQLTGGRYVGVNHIRGKNDSFTVTSAAGGAVTPDRLSSGTREQLYLALRMAYITHHCAQNEPLPVLMDDCFVNFDDKRLRHAIQAIGNWGESLQTVIFSCHFRTLKSVQENIPTAKTIRLEPVGAELASTIAL